jgi:thioredoxin-like negative regulator of GroEL
VNKHQLIVISGALVLLSSLYFFGRTKPDPKSMPAPKQATGTVETVDIAAIISSEKANLSPSRLARVTQMENSIVRGDLQTQKVQLYDELAHFWHDSAQSDALFCYYIGEKAKLVNSEKSLTFAANLFLQELKAVETPGVRTWMAVQAKDLFEKALEKNPTNDSSQIGLGSTYFFGAAGDGAPMAGITRIRDVAARDSTNMYAQFMLAYGGILSGQFEKAIERLEKVVRAEPTNSEAVFLLAEAYERNGDNANAVKWYEAGKKFVNRPEALHEIEERINSLKK